MSMVSVARTLNLNLKDRFLCGNQVKILKNLRMDSKPFSETRTSSPVSALVNAHKETSNEATVTLQEWQGWGTTSPVPSMVTQVIDDLKLLEEDIDAHMDFGGNHGKLRLAIQSGTRIIIEKGPFRTIRRCSSTCKIVMRASDLSRSIKGINEGEFKVQEDKKHREKYLSIKDSEKKLQFFSARQVACRLLGSRDYLCQKCWLPLGDCMCTRITSCSLCKHVRFWLYMHPKDFLRQNNTGKLLWQVYGTQSATLCLFGIAEHEETMWSALSFSGRNNVWCLYPNKNAVPKSVQDAFTDDTSRRKMGETMNFILIDGTWSNSNAMFQRLKDGAQAIWGEDLPCISLTTGASPMHELRPQPSWDRTCTAAAAIGILDELHLLPEFSNYGLESQADALGDALNTLCETLTTRRLRMGRSVSRKERYYSNIC